MKSRTQHPTASYPATPARVVDAGTAKIDGLLRRVTKQVTIVAKPSI